MIKFKGNIHLASEMYLGTLDMLSMPPATTTSFIPNWMLCAANIVAAITKNKIYKFFHNLISKMNKDHILKSHTFHP